MTWMNSASDSMKSATTPKLRVFFDADVLIAGSVSQSYSSASYVLLQLAELTLIHGLTCPYVLDEVERNLQAKLPQGLPVFRLLVENALVKTPDPVPDALEQWTGRADVKDIPVLAAAVSSKCQYLVTFNTRDYFNPPRQLTILKPGGLVRQLRERLAGLTGLVKQP